MRTRFVLAPLTVGALALAALTGCSSDSTDGAEAETTTTKPESQQAAAMERVANRYAHYDVVAYEGSGLKNLIISYGFTDLTVKDGELIAQESFCHADQRTDQPIETTISDAATSAIKPIPIATTVTIVDGKAHIERPETPTPIGIKLEDPANDVLPTDPKDPRIFDADGDGKPGITVHIKASEDLEGDLYLARRERFAYVVTEQGNGDLTGEVTDASEQLIIGSTDPRFLGAGQWTQHPDLSKSPIILKPVDASWDCERLAAERDEMFPTDAQVDW